MTTSKLPIYLRFDHIINVSLNEWLKLEGRPESIFYYFGQRNFQPGEWILFQCTAKLGANSVSRKLIRKVSAINTPVPMYLDDDSIAITVTSRPGDEYEVLMCEFEHFINTDNGISPIENLL